MYAAEVSAPADRMLQQCCGLGCWVTVAGIFPQRALQLLYCTKTLNPNATIVAVLASSSQGSWHVKAQRVISYAT